MEQNLVWAGLALVVVLVIVWRVDRFMHRRLTMRFGDSEVALMERRTQAVLSERTVDAQARLQNARLTELAAAAEAAVAMSDELAPDRLEAERAIIAARVEAERALAEEWVRARHQGNRDNNDIVERYDRYLEATVRRGTGYMTFEDFVTLLEDHGL